MPKSTSNSQLSRARSAGAEHLAALDAAHERIEELEKKIKGLEAALWASEQQAARVFRIGWAVRRMFQKGVA